jgi:hypothetical protein
LSASVFEFFNNICQQRTSRGWLHRQRRPWSAPLRASGITIGRDQAERHMPTLKLGQPSMEWRERLARRVLPDSTVSVTEARPEDPIARAPAGVAKAEGVNQSYACRMLRLSLLAPSIVTTIIDGQQNSDVMLKQVMKPLPVRWDEQLVELKFRDHA